MNRKILALAVLLCTLLLPVFAMAADTAALPQWLYPQEEEDQGRQAAFRENRGLYGLEIQSKWYKQAHVNSGNLNLRLYEFDGKQIPFEECLFLREDGTLKLAMRTSREGMAMMQIDQITLDKLRTLGVSALEIADRNKVIRAAYELADVAALRSFFGLGERELISLCGENGPVTAVSESGVRRALSM